MNHQHIKIFHSDVLTPLLYIILATSTLSPFRHIHRYPQLTTTQISTTHHHHATHPPHSHQTLRLPSQATHHPPLPWHNRRVPLPLHPLKPPTHPAQRIHPPLQARAQHIHLRRAHAQTARRERQEGRGADAADRRGGGGDCGIARGGGG